jgi:hypothetical protein
MRQIFFWTLVFFFALTTTVLKAQDKSVEEQLAIDFLNRYMDGIRYFDSDLTDHFPMIVQNEKDLSFGTPYGARAIGMAYLFFSHDVDTATFNGVIEKLSINEIPSYAPKDSSLIMIGDTLDYTDMVDGVPIPNFKSYQGDFGINRTQLPKRFKIYVLEARQGIYLRKEELPSGVNLPSNWQHGYSRGIASNERQLELLYWVCIW